MDVGFIGLGHMGAPMAANLLKRGHHVVVFNRTREKARALADMGAHAAHRVAEACHGEILVTMLSDDAAVESVVFGDDGALANLRRGGIHISMSTISVALSERLAAAHATAGRGYVAAPVFGRPEAAAAGKLFVVAAGMHALVARCNPLFDAMGQKTFEISERPRDANVIKLTGNFLIASVLESLGEGSAARRDRARLGLGARLSRHHGARAPRFRDGGSPRASLRLDHDRSKPACHRHRSSTQAFGSSPCSCASDG
ncbi:MAG: NAD(P)-dependent oxidoreductase [Reyranella sp.]